MNQTNDSYYSFPLIQNAKNEQFGHSIQNIMSTLQTQSTKEEIKLARFFTCLMTFEKHVNMLKKELFEQPEIMHDNYMQLFNTIFKSLDRQLRLQVTIEDINLFLNNHIGIVGKNARHIPTFVRLFAGRAAFKLTNEKQNQSFLSFADFLMIVTPRHLFQLKLQTLFKNSFPVYDMDRSQTTSLKSRELVAQIIELWLQLIDELQLFNFSAYQRQWLFKRIKGEPFTSSDLFSFILNLPVIFSTADCNLIFEALKTNKSHPLVDYEDFEHLLSICTPQSQQHSTMVTQEDKENMYRSSHNKNSWSSGNIEMPKFQQTTKSQVEESCFSIKTERLAATKSTDKHKRRADSSLYAETSRDRFSPSRESTRLVRTQRVKESSIKSPTQRYQDSSPGSPPQKVVIRNSSVSSCGTRESRKQLKPKIWAQSNTKSIDRSPPQIRGRSRNKSEANSPPARTISYAKTTKEVGISPYRPQISPQNKEIQKSRNLSQVSFEIDKLADKGVSTSIQQAQRKQMSENASLARSKSSGKSQLSAKARTAYQSQPMLSQKKQSEPLKIYRIKRYKPKNNSQKNNKSYQSLPKSEDRPESPGKLIKQPSLTSLDRERERRLSKCLKSYDNYQKALKKYNIISVDHPKQRKCCKQKDEAATELKKPKKPKKSKSKDKPTLKQVTSQKLVRSINRKNSEAQISNEQCPTCKRSVSGKTFSKPDLSKYKEPFMVSKPSLSLMRSTQSKGHNSSKKKLLMLSPSLDLESPSMFQRKVIKASQRNKSDGRQNRRGYEKQTACSQNRYLSHQRMHVGPHYKSSHDKQPSINEKRENNWVDILHTQQPANQSVVSENPKVLARRYSNTYGSSYQQQQQQQSLPEKSQTSRLSTLPKKKREQLKKIQSSFSAVQNELKSLKQVLKQNGINM